MQRAHTTGELTHRVGKISHLAQQAPGKFGGMDILFPILDEKRTTDRSFEISADALHTCSVGAEFVGGIRVRTFMADDPKHFELADRNLR